MTTLSSQSRDSKDAWRLGNAGRILGNAVTRFEARVLELMSDAGHADTRLPHVNLTRHLDLDGTRITELARRAHMTNAAMTELIDQCEALGLVVREVDASDKRARTVQFTDAGRVNYWQSVKQASLGELWQDINTLDVSGYDLVLTDFEPITAHADIPRLGQQLDAA